MPAREVSLMSGTMLPGAVVANEDVGEDDELAHDRDEGDLGGFSGGPHGLVVGPEVWVVAGCDEGAHVESGAHAGASTGDGGAGLGEGLACASPGFSAGVCGLACAPGGRIVSVRTLVCANATSPAIASNASAVMAT